MHKLWETDVVYEQDMRLRLAIDRTRLRIDLVCEQGGMPTSTALLDLIQICVDIENRQPLQWMRDPAIACRACEMPKLRGERCSGHIEECPFETDSECRIGEPLMPMPVAAPALGELVIGAPALSAEENVRRLRVLREEDAEMSPELVDAILGPGTWDRAEVPGGHVDTFVSNPPLKIQRFTRIRVAPDSLSDAEEHSLQRLRDALRVSCLRDHRRPEFGRHRGAATLVEIRAEIATLRAIRSAVAARRAIPT